MVERLTPPGSAACRFQLTPNCAASWAECWHVVALTALPTGLIAFGFSWLGFWPIAPLCGAELLALLAGFYVNAHRQRDCEWLELTEDRVILIRVEHRREQQWHWQRAFAVFVIRSERPDEDFHLFLRSHGRETEFARALNDDDKRQLIQELSGLLH